MAGGYSRFLTRTHLYGKNSREEKINDAKHILDLEFRNDSSYCENMYLWIAGENPHKDVKVDIRIFNRRYSAANGNTAQFEMPIGQPADIGNYYYDTETGRYWICTELFYVNEIHYSGKLTLCNWNLRWQAKDGRIINYPCHDINSTQYNSGEAGDKTMVLGSSQHMVTVQATPDTVSLATPQRFFVSRDFKIPYRVTQNDTVSNYYGNGLCKITLFQDELREEDNTILGICDYVPENPPSYPAGTITINGNPYLKVGYDSDFYINFHEMSPVQVEWEVISDFDLVQVIEPDSINLKTEDDALIGRSFILRATAGSLLAEKKIHVIEAF